MTELAVAAGRSPRGPEPTTDRSGRSAFSWLGGVVRPWWPLLLVGAVIAVIGTASFGSAAAAPLAASAHQPAQAFVRAAHLSPDTGPVDVYLGTVNGPSKLWLAGVAYGDVSTYRRVAPGKYEVSMRPAGASASAAAELSWPMQLAAGQAYTAAAIGSGGARHGVNESDRLRAPRAGTGVVRVLQASSRAGTVSVSTSQGVLAPAAIFGSTTGYVTVPAGTWQVRVSSKTHPSLAAQVDVTVGSQSVSSLVVLDTPHGGLTVHALLDAAGAPTAPGGAVGAGGGGTAPRAAVHPLLGDILAVTGAALALLVGTVVLRRRFAPARS